MCASAGIVSFSGESVTVLEIGAIFGLALVLSHAAHAQSEFSHPLIRLPLAAQALTRRNYTKLEPSHVHASAKTSPTTLFEKPFVKRGKRNMEGCKQLVD